MGVLEIVTQTENVIPQKRQFNGRRHESVHGRSMASRLKYVQARQMLGYFEVDTMQFGKKQDDLLVAITGKVSRQQQIVQRVSGRNSQAVTSALICFYQGIKNANQSFDHARRMKIFNW